MCVNAFLCNICWYKGLRMEWLKNINLCLNEKIFVEIIFFCFPAFTTFSSTIYYRVFLEAIFAFAAVYKIVLSSACLIEFYSNHLTNCQREKTQKNKSGANDVYTFDSHENQHFCVVKRIFTPKTVSIRDKLDNTHR